MGPYWAAGATWRPTIRAHFPAPTFPPQSSNVSSYTTGIFTRQPKISSIKLGHGHRTLRIDAGSLRLPGRGTLGAAGLRAALRSGGAAAVHPGTGRGHRH